MFHSFTEKKYSNSVPSILFLLRETLFFFSCVPHDLHPQSGFTVQFCCTSLCNSPHHFPASYASHVILWHIHIHTTLQQPPKHIESFGSVTGYYIGYKIVGSDKPYTFKTVEDSSHVHSKLEAIVSGLKKSTMYTFSIQAFNTKGAGPSSPEVTGKTLDKDPPAAPKLSITSVFPTSVTLSWILSSDSSPVNGWYLWHHFPLILSFHCSFFFCLSYPVVVAVGMWDIRMYLIDESN